jgi:ParB family transcriptional regulator, chromosome partitioning protein
MKGKDILRDLAKAGRPMLTDAPALPARSSGAVRAMGLGLDRLTHEAARARDLQQALDHGEHVLELDPDRIDPSFIRDRIDTQTDADYEALKSSIALSGQQVPVLVRPHPAFPDRYQAAYGHRRIRAARDLGRSVRAVIKRLTDSELVTAQAQENGPRLDLSYIERSQFARALARHGFGRDMIGAALGIDLTEVSRLFTLADSIPDDLVAAIGPAPKIGRPRWLALARKLHAPSVLDRARRIMASEDFQSASSDERFQRIATSIVTSSPAPSPKGRHELILDGNVLGVMSLGPNALRVLVSDPSFARFVADRMAQLLSEFAGQASASPDLNSKGGHQRKVS